MRFEQIVKNSVPRFLYLRNEKKFVFQLENLFKRIEITLKNEVIFYPEWNVGMLVILLKNFIYLSKNH